MHVYWHALLSALPDLASFLLFPVEHQQSALTPAEVIWPAVRLCVGQPAVTNSTWCVPLIHSCSCAREHALWGSASVSLTSGIPIAWCVCCGRAGWHHLSPERCKVGGSTFFFPPPVDSVVLCSSNYRFAVSGPEFSYALFQVNTQNPETDSLFFLSSVSQSLHVVFSQSKWYFSHKPSDILAFILSSCRSLVNCLPVVGKIC